MTCNRMMDAFVSANTVLVDDDTGNDVCHNRLCPRNDSRSGISVVNDVIDGMISLQRNNTGF